MTREIGATLPRTIWFLWFQGLEEAPSVVTRCYRSWVVNNPGWNVVLLDNSNLGSHELADLTSEQFASLAPAHRSDLIRLELLARHGGVWADATCYCTVPLDSWLPERRAEWAPPMANWFLAASPSNALIVGLQDMLLPYWRDHSFDNAAHPRLFRLLERRLRGGDRWTRWWFSRLVRDGLSLSPYYAFHYAFAELLRTQPEIKAVWEATPRVSAGPSMRLLLNRELPDDVRGDIDARKTPVYKLSWKVPPTASVRYLLGDESTSPL
jgi:hypothetical protein